MSAQSLGPDGDVESLFSDLEPEALGPPSKVHSAVTMRPDPSHLEAVRAAPGHGVLHVVAPVNLVAAPIPAAPVVIKKVPPAVPSGLVEAVALLREAPGVSGYVVQDADGERGAHGAADSRFADRLGYVARLAALVGDELGLEGLREVQAAGAERRIAFVLARDGASLAIAASADAPIDELTGRRR